MLETALQLYPYGAETVERTDKLVKAAEDLKDEALKKRAYEYSVKNAEHLLKNPGQLANSEVDEPWLYFILADAAENQKNEKLAKDYYMKVFESYTKQIKKEGLNEKTERGMNLERIYALHKAGQSEKASQMYEDLEKIYPEEFTFYHNHASVLKELKQYEKALTKAELAYKYSYGDNQLRAVANLASLALAQHWIYRFGARLLPIINPFFRKNNWLSGMPYPLNRWTKVRPLPSFGASFRRWWNVRSTKETESAR